MQDIFSKNQYKTSRKYAKSVFIITKSKIMRKPSAMREALLTIHLLNVKSRYTKKLYNIMEIIYIRKDL